MRLGEFSRIVLASLSSCCSLGLRLLLRRHLFLNQAFAIFLRKFLRINYLSLWLSSSRRFLGLLLLALCGLRNGFIGDRGLLLGFLSRFLRSSSCLLWGSLFRFLHGLLCSFLDSLLSSFFIRFLSRLLNRFLNSLLNRFLNSLLNRFLDRFLKGSSTGSSTGS